jgi:hypothetical protein
MIAMSLFFDSSWSSHALCERLSRTVAIEELEEQGGRALMHCTYHHTQNTNKYRNKDKRISYVWISKDIGV